MNLIRTTLALLAFSTLVGFSACSTTQTGAPAAAPRTFAQGLVYGYETNATVRKSAAAALDAKIISKSDAQHVLTTTNTVREALDESRRLGCPAMASVPTGASRDLPACLEGLPPTVTGKLDLAVGLAEKSYDFLKTVGAIK